MAKLNIGLPDKMKQFVDDQTLSGRFADNESYIQDLIRRDQERQQKIQAIQKAVDEGIASGESGDTMQDILQSLKGRRSQSA